MSITLDGDLDPGGQLVESTNFGVAPGVERQTMSIGGWDAQTEKVAVKAADPGNGAFRLAVWAADRTTASAPTLTSYSTFNTSHKLISSNANRLRARVVADPSNTGEIFIFEGAGPASAALGGYTDVLCKGESWTPDVNYTGDIYIFIATDGDKVTGVEYIP